MILLVLAAAAVYGALLVATLILERGFFAEFAQPGQPLLAVVLSVVLVPTLATWLTAEVIGGAFHKRVLDRRVRRRSACLLVGFGAGFLGVLVSALALVLLDRALPDAVLTGVAACAATALVMLPLPRQRGLTCARCAYDMTGSAGSAICPECGFDVMGGEKRIVKSEQRTEERTEEVGA